MKKRLLRTKDMFLILLISLQLNTHGKMIKQSNIYMIMCLMVVPLKKMCLMTQGQVSIMNASNFFDYIT